MSEAVQVLAKLIDRMRTEMLPTTDHKWELEIRVGKCTDTGFSPGYEAEWKPAVIRLLDRLTGQVKTKQPGWSAKPQVRYKKYEYPNQIIRVCTNQAQVENKMNRVYRKHVLVKHDIKVMHRTLDLRISLAQEEELDYQSMPDLKFQIENKAPLSTTVLNRLSVTNQWQNNTFQYDISMVSPKAPNSIQCTDVDCSFHCELELTQLDPTVDSVTLATEYLGRALALLGSTRRIKKNQTGSSDTYVYEELPTPVLYLVK